MKLEVYNLQNEKVGEVDVAAEVFGTTVKPHLHHEAVRTQLAARHRGTAKAKGRGEVNGSKHKMYRQKGTGRARHSTRKPNIFVGGGAAFGPKPRSYTLRTPKRVRRAALRSVLSEKVKLGHLKVIESFELDEIKTQSALAILNGLNAERALVVDESGNENLKLSVRNLKNFKYLANDGLNVADVLRFDHLLVTRAALEKVQGALMP